MEKSIKNTLIHIGRIFLALYFLLPGVGKFIAWDDQVNLMDTHNTVSYTHLTLPTNGCV